MRKSVQNEISDAKPRQFVEVERIAGNRMYLRGHPYPHKGIPTIEALDATGRAKDVLKAWVRLPLPWRFTTAVNAAWRELSPYVTYSTELTNTAHEVLDALHPLHPKLATVLSHIVEYDAAYRFRLMDLCNETTPERLVASPRKEIARLVALNRERDFKSTPRTRLLASARIKTVGRLVSLALVYPPFKKAFILAIKSVDFKRLQFDEIDTYWACHKTDYDYFGKTYNERQALCKKMS